MKKLIALMLVLVMAVSFAACSQPAAEEPATTETTTPAEGTTEAAPAAGELKWDPANVQASVEAAVAATDGKIAIITNTVSQNEEEYRSAAAMVEKYGDRVIHDTMPDNFMAEQEQFISVFQIIVRIILALTLMTLMNAKLSIVAWVIAPIIVLYSVLFHNKIRARFTECDENEGVLSTIAQENLTGVRVVRAFGREKFERDRFEAQNNKYTECWISLTRTLSDFWAVGDFTSCLQILLVVVLGTVSCVNGNLTAGEFVSFSLYNTMLIGPVRRLGRIISEMSKAGVSIDRLGEVLEAETEQDAPNAAEAPMDKDITFENVSFHYGEDGPDVLENVSFTVPAGKSFGILGGTGSGKSSLLLLLCRLYAPTEGKITVGGVDIADMPARYVRENVGVVLQEPFLFSRSVQENIGICGASDAEIRAAAVTACVDGDITRFSQGYDTMVGERGVSLSGGQKQRVAIARMLTKKTPVIVFDDSLSAVDTETDEKIRSALDRDLGGATTIIISHRITTLLDCDNILVLEKGRVSQLGSPKELLAQPGIFRKIYDMQMSIGEEEGA